MIGEQDDGMTGVEGRDEYPTIIPLSSHSETQREDLRLADVVLKAIPRSLFIHYIWHNPRK